MKRARRSAGYTLIEVMLSVGVLSVGAVGLMAMQRAAIVANGDARSMGTASHVLRRWLERFRRDSLFWIASGNPPSGAKTLSHASDININTSYVGSWILPDTVDPVSADADPPVDAGDLEWYGADFNGLDSKTSIFFCTHVRLAWIVPNKALRTDLRTYWRRMHNVSSATNLTSMFTGCGSSLISTVTQELGGSDVVITSGKATKATVSASRLRAVYGSSTFRFWQPP